MTKLLTASNPKLLKGIGYGYLPYILHLAPHKRSGYNVCPGASPECIKLCLDHAGRGRFERTQKARIRKTIWFFEDRPSFLKQLEKDVETGIRKADRENLIPCFRFNGTSDIRWELYGIMEKFPGIQFYDYTALTNRKNLPSNYYLTYSRKETDSDRLVKDTVNSGTNVAVVFDTRKGNPLPEKYLGIPVIDGDVHDCRFLDPKGVIVGLRAKGSAIKVPSDFVTKG